MKRNNIFDEGYANELIVNIIVFYYYFMELINFNTNLSFKCKKILIWQKKSNPPNTDVLFPLCIKGTSPLSTHMHVTHWRQLNTILEGRYKTYQPTNQRESTKFIKCCVPPCATTTTTKKPISEMRNLYIFSENKKYFRFFFCCFS